MPELNAEQLNEKPIRIKLKSGSYITGRIQMGAAALGDEDQIPFISTQNLKKLQAHLGDLASGKTYVPITMEEARAFVEFIPREQIDDFEIMETEINGVRLITKKNRGVQLPGFTVQLTNIDSPGMVKVQIKIPGHDKLFDVGERVIKNGMVDVPISLAFMSYAREDEPTVAEIRRRLNDFAIVTWFDKQNLIPGDDWEMRIERAIEKSDFFLLFLSRKTEEKIGFRNREIQLAIKQQSYHPRGHIFLIPILLDDCTPPHDLRGSNWLKATDDKWFERLVDVIALPYGKKTIVEVRRHRNRLYDQNDPEATRKALPEAIELSPLPPTSEYELLRTNMPDKLSFISVPWRYPLWQVANQPCFFAYKARMADGVCLIERIDLPDGRIVVACIEIAGNPGTSITNCVEDLCLQVCERFEISSDRLIWLQHYDYDENQEWKIVTFTQMPPQGPFANPHWTEMTDELWRELRLKPKKRLTQRNGQFYSKLTKLFHWPDHDL